MQFFVMAPRMKIEIEFENSYEARLTIDGKQLTIDSVPGMTKLKGSEGQEYTLGGQIANTLFGTIAKIQQAWADVEDEDPGKNTWDAINQEAIEAVNDRLW